MYFTLEKMAKKGKTIVEKMLSGEISDFRSYVFSTTSDYQTPLSRANSIGKYVSEYLKSISDSKEKTKIIDMIFSIKSFEFIEIFRIAKDLAMKFDKYECNPLRKKAYLAQHPGTKEEVFNYAYEMAKYSSLSEKSDFIEKSVCYGDIQSEFITA